jgi:hypothetical protein
MKQITAAFLGLIAAVYVTACATGDAPSDSKLAPEIEVAQLSGPGDQGYPPGLFQVELAMEIKNNSSEPLTFKQLDLQPMGGGGPYRLRQETYYFNETIPPQQAHALSFWANAFTTGDYRSIDAYAPVSIRGIATFASPAGTVRKIFVKVLPQDRGRR